MLSDFDHVRKFRRRQAGISLVEVCSASVCVGILGAVTISGTSAAKARLQESVLHRQAVLQAENKLNEIRVEGTMADLMVGETTETFQFENGATGTLTTIVQGTPPPPPVWMSLEGLDGDPVGISDADRYEGTLMILRTMANNDLTQFTAQVGGGEASYDLYFSNALNDNSPTDDTQGELIFIERGGNDSFTIQALNAQGEAISQEVGLDPKRNITFKNTTPISYAVGETIGTLPLLAIPERIMFVSVDISKELGVTSLAGVRVLRAPGDSSADLKVLGLDTTAMPSNGSSPELLISGPGKDLTTNGAVMLNGVQFGTEKTSRFVYAGRIANVVFQANKNQIGFVSRASNVFDVTIKANYNARTLSGERPRSLTVTSAVPYGTPYF